MRNLDKGTLSHEQARHFREQGYYRLTDVFTTQDTAEMRAFVAAEAAKEPTERDKILGGQMIKMYGLYDRSPELMQRVVSSPALIGALKSLVGPNVVLLKNRHNHATMNNRLGSPGEGLHRDILQPTRGIVTAAVYLEDSTIQNGATRLIPGSQNLPYVGVPEETGGGVWMDQHEEYKGLEDQAIQIPMPEGSVLLFNSLVFHGVSPNRTGDSRMSMTLAYRAADELDAAPDGLRQLVVAGEQSYRGNDRFLPLEPIVPGA
ncbi:MAG TPA: phytanoyl-CoA dioxygenase family protein [Candidatus Saccharimonadales bacterium]|nr:phytanoyl-CoA dioxygenase family protein [Candidatus Saccharimonadales bacterium]